MVSFKPLLVAGTAILSAATAAADPVPNNFSIDAAVKGDTPSAPLFGGRILFTFHTGAGESAVVAEPTFKRAPKFYQRGTRLLNTQGTPPFPAGLGLSNEEPFNSSAPAGYRLVTVNAGLGTKGFTVPDTTDDTIDFKPPKKFADWETFAICKVDQIATAPSAGPQYQLLWRPKGVKPVYRTKCGDVVFYPAVKGAN